MSDKFQAVVIGGGPGGYVCAIRLAQLGLKTACIESRGSLGGTCLNVGCIPSKNLLNISENYHKAQNFSKLGIEVGEVKLNLQKMMQNKDKAVTILTKGVEFLFKKNKVTYFKGTGSFKSANKISILDDQKKETIIETDKTVISTGSVPVALPGIEFDEKIIVSSTGALTLETVPKKMVVVGGGYIGLEMGSVWSRLGAEVHVVEFLEHITPGMDREISTEFMKILKKQGINFHMQTKIKGIKKKADGAIVSTSDKEGKKVHPTQKPENLLSRVIMSSSNLGDIVLDPFFGTGTTGAVSKKLGRNFIGIEQNAKYGLEAEKRINNAKAIDSKELIQTPRKTLEPRIPFGHLLEQGLINPGELLQDSRNRWTAKIRADGSLISKDKKGSIHSVGAHLQGLQACNGWTFWHIKRSGKLISIDNLRHAARAANQA